MRDEKRLREVREVREAGLRALDSLEKARKALDSACGWGIFDLLGGGKITTLVKHSLLDDAREYIDQAEYDLDIFRQELADVRLPDVEIDGFLTFADFFFDGFFADLLVQRRIDAALRQIDQARQEVENVLRQLP